MEFSVTNIQQHCKPICDKNIDIRPQLTDEMHMLLLFFFVVLTFVKEGNGTSVQTGYWLNKHGIQITALTQLAWKLLHFVLYPFLY